MLDTDGNGTLGLQIKGKKSIGTKQVEHVCQVIALRCLGLLFTWLHHFVSSVYLTVEAYTLNEEPSRLERQPTIVFRSAMASKQSSLDEQYPVDVLYENEEGVKPNGRGMNFFRKKFCG